MCARFGFFQLGGLDLWSRVLVVLQGTAHDVVFVSHIGR